MNEAHTIENADRVGELIEAVASEFDDAGLHYGHGTDNPLDEAAALVFHCLRLDHSSPPSIYARPVGPEERGRVRDLAAERIASRKPLPYLLGEAWFAGMPFEVEPGVLVPRSPIAELIVAGYEPWLEADGIRRVLEIGTGSGCIAIATALHLPGARVVATDVSADALGVARRNVARHGVETRVELVATSYAEGIEGPFDLVVSNPPYVPSGELAGLPPEYGHEPALGLESGPDGLDSARRILQDAPGLLADAGALVLEVGAQWQALEQAFPFLPFTWLEFDHGGEGVALLYRRDFPGQK